MKAGMKMSQLKLEVERLAGDRNVHLIRPTGLIDIITSPELDICIADLIDNNNFCIVIDMSGTSYISSAGWGIFIGSLRKIRENNGDIVFINMSDEIKDFFITLNLDSRFSFFDSKEDAIIFFAQKQ